MHDHIALTLARAHQDDLRRDADRQRAAREASTSRSPRRTIRSRWQPWVTRLRLTPSAPLGPDCCPA